MNPINNNLSNLPLFFGEQNETAEEGFNRVCLNGNVLEAKQRLENTPFLINRLQTQTLFSLCSAGHFPLLLLLFEYNPSLINLKNLDGENLLHLACQSQNPDMVKYLYHQKPALLDELDNEGATPFRNACIYGNLEIVRFLHEIKEDLIYIYDQDGTTPLHFACENTHFQVIEFLLEKNPSLINQKNEQGETPLIAAIENNHRWLEILKIFYKHDPNLLVETKLKTLTLFQVACGRGKLEEAKFLYKTHPSCIEQVTFHKKNTPLHIACKYGQVEIAKFLMQVAPLLAFIPNKKTKLPFHIAYEATCVVNKHLQGVEMIQTLLEGNRDWINFIDPNTGNTLLHTLLIHPQKIPLDSNRMKIIELLIAYGINPSLQNKEGNTPLHLLCDHPLDDYYWEQIKKIGESLVRDPHNKHTYQFSKRGKREIGTRENFKTFDLVNCSNQLGNTPLHLAAKQNSPKMLQFLLEKGALLHEQNHLGDTVLHCVTQNANLECAKIIYFRLNNDLSLFKVKNQAKMTALDCATEQNRILIEGLFHITS